MIKNRSKIFTHCHSKTVIQILKDAKKKGRKFEVFNSEIRPKLLGRRMAKALSENGIKVTHMADLAALEKIKECDLFLFGAESITKNGNVHNKIGTKALLEICSKNKIPAYCCANPDKINAKINRINSPNQVWKNPPKKVKIINPGSEEIPRKLFKGFLTSSTWQSQKKT